MKASIFDIVYSIFKLVIKIISKSKNLYSERQKSNTQDGKIIELTEKANNSDSIIELTDVTKDSDFTIELENPIETKNENTTKYRREYHTKLKSPSLFVVYGDINNDIANNLKSLNAKRKGLIFKEYVIPIQHLQKTKKIIKDLNIDKLTYYAYRCDFLYKLSFAKHIPYKIDTKRMNITLYDFQQATLAYALITKKCIIGDEAGVGKTFPAIALGKYVNTHGTLVICPANLKLNWKSEIRRAYPNDSIFVCYGRSSTIIPKSNWIIINYDIISGWAEYLSKKLFNVIILDEIHNCKNPKAQRTIACKEISKKSEYCLGLTGTLFRNHMFESKTQLEIITRKKDVVDFAKFKKYISKFENEFFELKPKQVNESIRATCYIRREKRDVLLQLPKKMRSMIHVDINNKKHYEKLENEAKIFINKFRQQLSDKNSKMHVFAILNKLRQETGIGKIPAAVDWINDFLEQTTEKLVVFAYHRAVQDALTKSFPNALSILGTTSQQSRHDAICRFQNSPNDRLIICSLSVASEGITLTAASTILSIELDYVPAKLFDQMEGRIDRLGQMKPVQVYYLIGEGTIDNRMIKLLQTKWNIVSAGNIGLESKYSANIFEELIASYGEAV
jgi:SNF2 family DNA or RNA helicase